MSLYSKLIEETCPGTDVKLIEELMRQEYRTLDGLSLGEFKKLAKKCEQIAKDPQIIALYKQAPKP